MPAHGDSYVVTGSGFGSKTGSAPNLWDNCTASNFMLASGGFYNRAWHWDASSGGTDGNWSASSQGTTGDQLDINHEGYRDPTNYPTVTVGGVEPAHSRNGGSGQKVLCGRCQGVGVYGSAVYFSRDYTRPNDTDWWTVLVYYHRWNPAFVFGSDWNYKFHWVAADDKWPSQGRYAYITITQNLTSSSDVDYTFAWQDSAVIGSNPANNDADLDQTGLPNYTQGWVKVEIVINYKSSAGGKWKMRLNNIQIADVTLQTHNSTGLEGGTGWQESIGGFYRAYPHDENALYWQDIYRDVQASNPGRFYLTNHATWGSETIYEIQPWTSWSATSVTLTCNGGALSDGTVHVHYRDEVNGHQYLGTVTLGAGGGGEAPPPFVLPQSVLTPQSIM